MTTSTSVALAAEDLTIQGLLKPHGHKIADAISKKLAGSVFDEVEQVLKATNTLLFKVAKNLDDPRKIEDSVKQIISSSNEIRAYKTAYEQTMLNAANVYAQAGEERPMLSDEFERKKQDVKRAPVESHEFWKKYQQAVTGSAGGNNADDDVQGVDEEDNEKRFKCPVSMAIMTKPVRNECGHVYDESSAQLLLKSAQGSRGALCPVRGCKKPIMASRLVVDENLAYEIEEWQKQQKRKKPSSKKKSEDQSESSSKKKKKRMVDDDDEEEEA